jgi:hypothetical protein
METYIFKCEGCGGQKSYPIHEAEMAEIDERKPIQKHCPTCRTMTNWMLAFPEWRSGTERRERAQTIGK